MVQPVVEEQGDIENPFLTLPQVVFLFPFKLTPLLSVVAALDQQAQVLDLLSQTVALVLIQFFQPLHQQAEVEVVFDKFPEMREVLVVALVQIVVQVLELQVILLLSVPLKVNPVVLL